jgi:hypothetical protein
MASYPGRTDLQVPKVAPNQPQGVATEQKAALHAVPMASPVNVVPLSAPTQNPNEPVTAGSPVGPGPGVEALGPQGAAMMGQPQDPVRQQVAALYKANPNPDLLRLIELLDTQGR